MKEAPYHNARPCVWLFSRHYKTCRELENAFSEHGCEVRVFTALEELMTGAQGIKAEIVVLDWSEAGTGHLLALRNLKASYPTSQILVVVDSFDAMSTAVAFRAGANDVYPRPLDAGELAEVAIENISRASHLVRPNTRLRDDFLSAFSLTHREQDVLRLIASGLTNKEVALHLDISPRTVEVHRARIMDKLGATNTSHLMRILLG